MKGKIFDLEALKREFETAGVDTDMDGNTVKRVYLGTVMALTPSGKYYTPFASNNVDPCPRCKGTGETHKTFACDSCKGTGKRTMGEIATMTGETVDAVLARLLAQDVTLVGNTDESLVWTPCRSCNGTGQEHHTCSWCDGLGSREATLDQRWYEQADKELATIGAFLESGEGCATDLLAVMVVDVDVDNDDES
jgi:RecJ-like exonuclease